MKNEDLVDALARFKKERKFNGKGPLCVALVVTDHAVRKGLPLDTDDLVTEGGGQVLGLGRAAVQSILARHGIHRELAAEGGRTSRGSLGKMREYVQFLNGCPGIDLKRVEEFWVGRVKDFFAQHPFKIKLDPSIGLRGVVRDVIEQAVRRQQESTGTNYAGIIMQHLIGAKLDCALGPGKFTHHNASTADAPGGRAGDFHIGDVAIHVTTAPGEAVIRRCSENIDVGLRPLLVTLERGSIVAQELAKQAGLGDRLDIFEVEQFIAVNLYEWAGFAADGRKLAVKDLVERYNQIVAQHESDPSLAIKLL